MSRRSFSRNARSSGRPLRGMDWGGAGFTGAVIAGTRVGAWILSPQDVAEGYVDPTLMATRITWLIRTRDIPTGGGQLTGIGLIAWDGLPASGSTIPTSLPGPVSDPNLDWIYHAYVPTPQNLPAATSFTNSGEFLSKARRRLGNQTGILLTLQSQTIGADFSIGVRILLKE